MADISAWSPVDESNTSAPPNGWPENMQPSAVNNSARALMGGVRRWYDTVTAQLSSITAALSNYLPLSGGTLTGTLNGPYLHSTGDIRAENAITSVGNTVVGVNLSVGGTATANVVTANAVNSNGNMSVAGTLTGAQLTSTGNINAIAYDCDNVRVIDTNGGAPLLYRQGGVWAIQLQSINTYYDNQGHIFRNQGAANTFTIDPSGNVNATAQVQGSTIYSRGNIDGAGNLSMSGAITAGGNIVGGFVQSAGTVYANGMLDANYVNSRGDAFITGTLTVPRINMSGALQTSNWVIPFADHGFNCGLPGLNADSMHAYAFVVPSDERLKADIATPADCLPLVQAINAHTYRLPGAPDPNATRWGFIAQQVGEVMRLNNREFAGHRIDTNPQTGEQHQGLDTHQLVAVLWRATQELAAKVADLEAR